MIVDASNGFLLGAILIVGSMVAGAPAQDADEAADGAATVMLFEDLRDLGIPYQGTFTNHRHHYARNPWSLFAFGGLLFIAGGDANNINYMPITGPFSPKAVDLSDDTILTLNEVNEEELNVFRVIDGQLVVPGIDPTENSDVNLYLFQERFLIDYPVARSRNHMYDVHKSRRNGRFFAATGWNSSRDSIVSSSDGLIYGWTHDQGAMTVLGARGLALLEFGGPGEERLFVVQWSVAYDLLTADVDFGRGLWLNYEYNFETMQWEGVTNLIWAGLDPGFTDPAVEHTAIGQSGRLRYIFLPWKVTRVDDDTYMAVFGRRKGGNRFDFPGLAYGYDDGSGEIDNVKGSGAGGVYRITLGSTPPNDRARGDTFLQCERVLDPALGRQWDFQVVGDDVYVLTETPDLAIHVYRNGEEVLRVMGAPTFARSFAVVGDSIYLGLGSEVSDPYRNNGSALSPHTGRILKAEGVFR